VNGMVFVRPGKGELRAWEDLGAKGWNWDALLPYYKKVGPLRQLASEHGNQP